MDEWVPEDCCRCDGDAAQLPQAESTNRKRKRKRDVSYSLGPSALNGFALRRIYGENKGSPMPTEIVMTEEDFDLQHHQQLRAQRNFDVVIFDVWKIKPWWVVRLPNLPIFRNMFFIGTTLLILWSKPNQMILRHLRLLNLTIKSQELHGLLHDLMVERRIYWRVDWEDITQARLRCGYAIFVSSIWWTAFLGNHIK